MSTPPGHPAIPDGVSANDIVAIVTIHDPRAFEANQNTPYRKTQSRTPENNGAWYSEGCNVFLHFFNGQPCYTLGRSDSKGLRRDVHLARRSVGIHQFTLLPNWDGNCWRLQSATETIASMNGAPIQDVTSRTRKLRTRLPHAIHLQQDVVNRVNVNGLNIDVWLLKTVREVYPSQVFWPSELLAEIQDFARRPEEWARDVYIMREQVSAKSYRVLQRFTGKVETAKLFQDQQRGRELRDVEFVKFGKEKVDASLVRYQQSVDIDQILAVITDTHEEYATYAAFEAGIKQQHPDIRFLGAPKLLRRLFSALAFLHFHGIIHGNVSKESVLLRIMDFKLESVLLVDYAPTTFFPANATPPVQLMIEDGRAAMELVEDSCDIWQLRKAATKDAMNEGCMAKKTEEARQNFRRVERVVAYFFETNGGSRDLEKGAKLLRLLDQMDNLWHRAQNEQAHNATCREVGMCQRQNIEEMEQDWSKTHGPFRSGEKKYMLMTLGNPWLDRLVSSFYHKRWETTPHEVCTKIREVAGDNEEPWQTFGVTRTVTFAQDQSGFEQSCFLQWLAGCCEAYPEWRQALESEFDRHVRPQYGTIPHDDVPRLRDALRTRGTLPAAITATFERLCSDDIETRPSTQVQETHQVWYHMPSRMFNVTQVHRLAALRRFTDCVTQGDLRCDHYVEVRGEPKFEGFYASLSPLAAFGMQLGSTIEVPNHTHGFPTYDPADFSQVVNHVVLVHTGLIPWASVTRHGKQFNFNAPRYVKDFEPHYTFLPTYFGSMKVLPPLEPGKDEYVRADHWSRFRTAEDLEQAKDVRKRKILPVVGPSQKLLQEPRHAAKPSLTAAMDVDESALVQTLKDRAVVCSLARPPMKRNADAQSSVPTSPTAKRTKASSTAAESSSDMTPPLKVNRITTSFMDRAMMNQERMAQGLPAISKSDVLRVPNETFYQRQDGVNENLLTSPPDAPAATRTAFTVASEGFFGLDEDIKQVDEWLAAVPTEEKEEAGPGPNSIFGMHIHHSLRRNGSDASDTEPEECEDEGGADIAPDGSSSPSPAQPLRHVNGPGVPVPQWLANQQGADDEEDMPDTDSGESFSEDAE
jgi:hypothetical protein